MARTPTTAPPRPARPAPVVKEAPKDSSANIIRLPGVTIPRPAPAYARGKVLMADGSDGVGVILTAIDRLGKPVVSSITDAEGNYNIGLPPIADMLIFSLAGSNKYNMKPIQPQATVKLGESELEGVSVVANAYKWIHRHGLWLVIGGVFLVLILASIYANRK